MVGPDSGVELVSVGGKGSVVKATGEEDQAWLVLSGPGKQTHLFLMHVCVNIGFVIVFAQVCVSCKLVTPWNSPWVVSVLMVTA